MWITPIMATTGIKETKGARETTATMETKVTKVTRETMVTTMAANRTSRRPGAKPGRFLPSFDQ